MASKQEIQTFFKGVYAKSNKIMEIVLIGYFLFGIALSFFYDTYLVGIGVGGLCLILYIGAKALLRKTRNIQYVFSLIFGIFMAQFIYQMHGLFEMHFTAFIAIIAMITFQNKYAFIPQALFVVIHHSSFAYIQYLGVANENQAYKNIYFTQLEFMDLQTFLFHAGLYAIGVALAAIYAHNLEKHTTENAINILTMQEKEEIMKKNIEVANNIASGELETDIEVTEGDNMGTALLEMKNSLKHSADREKEERFINVGIAQISEIIRNNEGNLDELSYQVISYLVKYLGANQGAIFILMEEDGEEFLEQKGCYAYDRKKFLEKKLAPGEGILGQCFLEKQFILLKEIPKDYITITSGLGKATPAFLIVVPVMTEQVIEGVIEIASFEDFEQYKIDFLVKVCENIASVITSVKVNEQTKKLFEKSQEQTEMLRAQEEEMRQNMEELSATQEEMQRKTREFETRFQALNESNLIFGEFDPEGNVTSLNQAFANYLARPVESVVGLNYRILTEADDFEELVSRVRAGNKLDGKFSYMEPSGKAVYLYGSYVQINDESGSLKNIVLYGMPVSDVSTESTEVKSPEFAPS